MVQVTWGPRRPASPTPLGGPRAGARSQSIVESGGLREAKAWTLGGRVLQILTAGQPRQLQIHSNQQGRGSAGRAGRGSGWVNGEIWFGPGEWHELYSQALWERRRGGNICTWRIGDTIPGFQAGVIVIH